MNFLDIVAVAFALAMDCFAVAITTGLTMKKPDIKIILLMALYFGGFQGIMPVLGWFAGNGFAIAIASIDHWVAFALLAFIGGNMIRQSLSDEKIESYVPSNHKTLFGLAVATSIDALVVGVNLGLMHNSLTIPAIIIGVVSFVLTIAGVYMGCYFKRICKMNFELIGGIVLIVIGIKILIEHQFLQ